MKAEKNIIEDSVKLGSQIKEETRSMLKELLDETVRGYMDDKINESEEKPVDDQEKKNEEAPAAESEPKQTNEGEDYEVEDAEEGAEEPASEEGEPEGEPEAEAGEEGAEGEEDSLLDAFSTGSDNEYDLTGAGDDVLMKVFNILDNSDDLSVLKTEEGISVEDEEGNQLELHGEEGDGESEEEADIELDLDGEDSEGDGEEEGIEFDFESEEDAEPEEGEEEEGEEPVFEIHFNKGSKLAESLFVDNYQDKDPIEGLNNNEPAKAKRDWDAGVPKGTEKPFPGNANAKSAPFGGKVNEGVRTKSKWNQAHASKSPVSPDDKLRKGAKKVSRNGQYEAEVNEAIAKIQNENKMLKEALGKFKKSLEEAALVNVNLGQIVKLISENTTTAQEKKNIIERFANEAKTVEQSKTLYESIRQNLNNAPQKAPVLEQATTAEPEKKVVTENVVYQSREMSNIIDLMKRVENC